ncbi:MAG TPA: neprosin family prolyl endopeptidase [Pseudonocardiaceae bacterium]|nr:neprosin family prolyl endopeptidase [Pseudonocardiaceae bacterium]
MRRLFVLSLAVAACALLSTAPAQARPSQPLPPAGVGITPPPTAPVCYPDGSCYNYVAGREWINGTGASVLMTQEDPEIDLADPGNGAHSLQELAVETADKKQIIEIGWTVDDGLNGDTEPHLFIFHWIDGVATCYNACGFVQTSPLVTPGMKVTSGLVGQYGIAYRGGNWWLTYDGIGFGYFPGSIWADYHGFGLVQAFGEVVTSAGTTSCTDMGNGRFGTELDSSWIGPLQLTGGRNNQPWQVFATLPQDYRMGLVSPLGFHLGGPGTGNC